ncbi:choline ABC transporter permease, partial [Burkholderia sp. SIMBA_057]
MTVFDYLSANWPELLQLTAQHVWLVGIAVGCAIVVGVPL